MTEIGASPSAAIRRVWSRDADSENAFVRLRNARDLAHSAPHHQPKAGAGLRRGPATGVGVCSTQRGERTYSEIGAHVVGSVAERCCQSLARPRACDGRSEPHYLTIDV